MKKKEKEYLNKKIYDFIYHLCANKYRNYDIPIYKSNFFFFSYFDILSIIRDEIDWPDDLGDI